MNIIYQLRKAVSELEKIKAFSSLMPEVRVNFVYAKENPKKVSDVVAVDGRITVVNGYPKASGNIKYGASDHLARILIEIAKYDKNIRASINFKFSTDIFITIRKYCRKNSLIIGKIDRKQEPKRTQIKDGESIAWKVAYMYKTHNRIPKIFYENEGWGKEPLFVVVGKDPQEVLETVKGIIRET
jgi:hydroxymethylpyrimidine/phosphomethylpyrimidine kinase